MFELYTLWLWLQFSMGLVLESFVNSGLGNVRGGQVTVTWPYTQFMLLGIIGMVLFGGSQYKEASSYGGSEIRLTAVVFLCLWHILSLCCFLLTNNNNKLRKIKCVYWVEFEGGGQINSIVK